MSLSVQTISFWSDAQSFVTEIRSDEFNHEFQFFPEFLHPARALALYSLRSQHFMLGITRASEKVGLLTGTYWPRFPDAKSNRIWGVILRKGEADSGVVFEELVKRSLGIFKENGIKKIYFSTPDNSFYSFKSLTKLGFAQTPDSTRVRKSLDSIPQVPFDGNLQFRPCKWNRDDLELWNLLHMRGAGFSREELPTIAKEFRDLMLGKNSEAPDGLRNVFGLLDNKIVGGYTTHVYPEVAEGLNLYVPDEYRNKGLGLQFLLNHFVVAKGEGCRFVVGDPFLRDLTKSVFFRAGFEPLCAVRNFSTDIT